MNPPFTEGQEVRVQIERLGYGGDGVAHPEGYTVFVPRTAPGDELTSQIVKVRKRYARAIPLSLETLSPQRIEPRCSHYSQCGGCHYQHLDPEVVNQTKESQIHQTLKHLGPGSCEVRPIYVPEQAWNYRNRLTYHRSSKGKNGYVAWDHSGIVEIDNCPIAQPALNDLWGEVKGLLSDIPSAQLPYIVLRRSTRGEHTVLFSVTASKKTRETLQVIKEKTAPLAEKNSLHAFLIPPDSRSPFSKDMISISGETKVTEEIAGLEFQLRPDLFFQVHPETTQKLFTDVIENACALSPTRILDLYCGVGLFSLGLAQKNIPVVGIDSRYEAIQCAEESARHNQLDQLATFRAGKAERVAFRMWKKGERFDTALVDPPRKGLVPDLIHTLPRLGISTLLYVSCSPPTFARDAKALAQEGYDLKWVQPYDMFPQTYHVELLAKFSKLET